MELTRTDFDWAAEALRTLLADCVAMLVLSVHVELQAIAELPRLGIEPTL